MLVSGSTVPLSDTVEGLACYWLPLTRLDLDQASQNCIGAGSQAVVKKCGMRWLRVLPLPSTERTNEVLNRWGPRSAFPSGEWGSQNSRRAGMQE